MSTAPDMPGLTPTAAAALLQRALDAEGRAAGERALREHVEAENLKLQGTIGQLSAQLAAIRRGNVPVNVR